MCYEELRRAWDKALLLQLKECCSRRLRYFHTAFTGLFSLLSYSFRGRCSPSRRLLLVAKGVDNRYDLPVCQFTTTWKTRPLPSLTSSLVDPRSAAYSLRQHRRQGVSQRLTTSATLPTPKKTLKLDFRRASACFLLGVVRGSTSDDVMRRPCPLGGIDRSQKTGASIRMYRAVRENT